MNIKEIREKYPQYSDLSDVQLADALHKKHYSDLPRNEFFLKVGVPINRAGAVERGAEGFWRGFQEPAEGLNQLITSAIGNKRGSDYWINETKRRNQDLIQNVRGGEDDFDYGRAVGGMVAPLMIGAGTPLSAGLPARMAAGGATGAVQGLMTPVEDAANFGGQKARQAALGGAGGVAGEGIFGAVRAGVGAARKTVDPMVSSAIETARRYAIPLSIADITGSRTGKFFQSTIENMPLTGGAARRAEQQKAFNRAVSNQIGENSDNVVTAMREAKPKIGAMFDQAMEGQTVKLDNAFADVVNAIESKNTLRRAYAVPEITTEVNKARSLIADGALSAEAYKEIRSTLNNQADKLYRSGDSTAARALIELQDALDEAAKQSLPFKNVQMFEEARRLWKSLKTVERVAPRDAAGNVSAANLATAMKNASPDEWMYRGNTDMSQLARIGQFIKDPPNSGTSQREFWKGLLTGGGAVGAAASGGVDPVTSIAGYLLASQAGRGVNAAMYSPWLTQGLLSGAPQSAIRQGGRLLPVAGPALLLSE
jgi:hypothetical protein